MRDFLAALAAWFHLNASPLSFAAVAAVIAYLRNSMQEENQKRTRYDVAVCAAVAFGIIEGLSQLGVSTSLAWYASVLVGVVGSKRVLTWFERRYQGGSANDPK